MAGLLIICCCGCSGNDGPAKVDVTGFLTLDGIPMDSVSVRFHNSDIGGAVFPVDSDGAFKSSHPIVVGNYKVWIEAPGPTVEVNEGSLPVVMPPGVNRVDEVPKMYRDASSPEAVEVTADGLNHFEVNLTSE